MAFVQTPVLLLGVFCICILAQVSSADKSDKASLVSDAEDDRVKREPYYPYAYKGTSVSNSPASGSGSLGGAASQSKGAATGGGGQRSKREPQRYGYGGYYSASSGNQQSNAMGGSGSTVVTSGTANAGSGF